MGPMGPQGPAGPQGPGVSLDTLDGTFPPAGEIAQFAMVSPKAVALCSYIEPGSQGNACSAYVNPNTGWLTVSGSPNKAFRVLLLTVVAPGFN